MGQDDTLKRIFGTAASVAGGRGRQGSQGSAGAGPLSGPGRGAAAFWGGAEGLQRWIVGYSTHQEDLQVGCVASLRCIRDNHKLCWHHLDLG
jgi:hypothetical protein